MCRPCAIKLYVLFDFLTNWQYFKVETMLHTIIDLLFLVAVLSISSLLHNLFFTCNIYQRGRLTHCISVWYGNSSNQDCKALQRVVRLAEHISGSALPSLQDIYLKRCKARAAKIIKDPNHPGNRHFFLLPSGKRFRSIMAKTKRLRRSFFPQAIRLLNSNSVK